MSEKRKYMTVPRESATFDRSTMSEIRRAADTGIYDIRGAGASGSSAMPPPLHKCCSR